VHHPISFNTVCLLLACGLLAVSLPCGRVEADGRRDMVDGLIRKLQSADWRDRMSAVAGLGYAGTDARHALPELWKATSDEHEKVRRWAAKSLDKIYAALKTDAPLEELVKEIAAEPPPPKWNRIPAYVHRGATTADRLEEGGLAFDGIDAIDAVQDETQQVVFSGGWLGIRIPLPYAKHSHSRLVGRTVTLGKSAGHDVELTKGYEPQLWEEREIITCQVLHGKFAVLDLPELPQGRRWLIVCDDLENGFDLDRDRRADVTLRVVPPDYQRDE
jgi:hypothetical protein